MLTPNSAYIDDLYADFLHDPNSVGEEWRAYFQSRKDATIQSMGNKDFSSQEDMIEVMSESIPVKSESKKEVIQNNTPKETSIHLSSST